MKEFNNYTQYSESPVSEKITLAHVDCKARIFGFTSVSPLGAWYVETDYFVVGCKFGDTVLTARADEYVTEGEYYFDVDTSILYVHSTEGFTESADDPEVIPTYRLFFANAPINISHDLTNTGKQVYYEPRINKSPEFSSKLDNDQTGISLTGSGTLALDNNDLFFADLYELKIFENQEVSIFSHNRSLDPDQRKIIYRGTVTDKTYSTKEVSFKVKDVINYLNEKINLTKFSEITDSINVTPEVGGYVGRRIYGKQTDLRCQSVDMLYSSFFEGSSFNSGSYKLSGTVGGNIGSPYLNGSSFLAETSVDDTIYVGSEEYTYTIKEIVSDSILILDNNLHLTIGDEDAYVEPQQGYHNKNRKFLICDHPLEDLETDITEVIERNRVTVSNTTGFLEGDYVFLNDQYVAIKRISGNKFIFQQNLNSLPVIGDSVIKEKIQAVRVRYPEAVTYSDTASKKLKEIQLTRGDYSVTQTTEGSYLNIDADAERNATIPLALRGSYYGIEGFDMLWNGKPTVTYITCSANSSGDLYTKYFSIYNEEKDDNGNSVMVETVYWYSEDIPEDEDQTIEPEFTFSFATTEVSTANDTIYEPNHGLLSGQEISFSSTGALPTGITSGYDYVVRKVDANYFKIALNTSSIATKDLTTQGSGTHTASVKKDMIEIRLSDDNLTDVEVADETQLVIFSSSMDYLTKKTGGTLYLYTKASGYLKSPEDGNTGFLFSNIVTGVKRSDYVTLSNEIKNRDFVKTTISADSEYLEVAEVYPSSMRLRSNFREVSGNYSIVVKNVGYVQNDSHIYVDTLGKLDSSGEHIFKASEIIKDILTDGGLGSRLNTASFDTSSESLPYSVSIKIPDELSDSSPDVKKVIDDINQTVLGSLVTVDNLEIAFLALDVFRTSQALKTIDDSDILSWSIKNTGDNYKYLISKYNYTDVENEDDFAHTEYLYTSEFARYTDTNLTFEQRFFLSEEVDAIECGQRRIFYTNLSRSDISIKGKLSLAEYEMGDRVIVNLHGLFNRIGDAESNQVMGSVSSVKRSGDIVSLVVTTQGNAIFNKNGIITDDSRPDYDSSTEEDRLYSSYIMGENSTISSKSELLGCNCIA